MTIAQFKKQIKEYKHIIENLKDVIYVYEQSNILQRYVRRKSGCKYGQVSNELRKETGIDICSAQANTMALLEEYFNILEGKK